MSFTDRYNKLNTEQKQAVDAIYGPVMVVAGPGSGKTELLGLRVANILKQTDTKGDNILCLTFTDAAAKNMRDRLTGLIGIDAHQVSIHTFHSFALDIMHKHREVFYDEQQLQHADPIVQIEIIGEILEAYPLASPFSKKDPEGKFIYLRSIIDRIGKLKKAGLSPEIFSQIVEANRSLYPKIEALLIPIFEPRISKKAQAAIPELLKSLNTVTGSSFDHSIYRDYITILGRSLLSAHDACIESGKTTPLSTWKKEWLKKDPDTGELKLKDHHQLERNQLLAEVYGTYQVAMKQAGYIDFDDMIVDVITTLETKPGVLASLQEQYQFILVDEFQDTNDAQLRLIHLLTNHAANEGKPNIMVVGDDDQAIYKFQGAEINNILQFTQHYKETQVISLIKNYRSTNNIVQFATEVIAQGTDRLVNVMKEVNKKLEAANPTLTEGRIIAHSFDTAIHEYQYITQEIKKKRDAGYSASDIAIIARNHRQLEDIARHLQASHIPVSYERQRNVLDEPHIQQLLTLTQLIVSLSAGHVSYQNELMPEVLQYPFWELERSTIWELSIEASKKEHKRWIDVMRTSNNEQLKQIAGWLLDVASRVATHPLMPMLEELIGPVEAGEAFTSPFRRYYFTEERYRNNPQTYLQFLSSLTVLFSTVRQYAKRNTEPRLQDLLNCIDVYEQHGIAITDTAPYMSGSNAVHLLSAHKSKGLEFDTVFVINCQKDIWAKSQGRDLIAFPKNVPIDPSAETMDDFLRLFFVALTRAKQHLYVTSYVKKENGRDSTELPFITDTAVAEKKAHKSVSIEDTAALLEQQLFPSLSPIAIDEKAILAPLLEDYVMSVTHLNNFLDVSSGGPHYFFEQNLLRFPQVYQPHMSYGTVMHKTIETIYSRLKASGSLPTLSEAKDIFSDLFSQEQMDELSFNKYMEKGREAIAGYVSTAKGRIDATHWIETNFRQQQVMINDVHITGKIDKVVPDEEKKVLQVFDFKTGKAQKDWKGRDERKKITLHEYKRQLTFYKLLVEQSRDYKQYRVHQGVLEYVTPTKTGDIVLLPYDITEDDVVRLKLLISAVHTAIRQLEFPDISEFEPTLDGVVAFEDWMIDHFGK